MQKIVSQLASQIVDDLKFAKAVIDGTDTEALTSY